MFGWLLRERPRSRRRGRNGRPRRRIGCVGWLLMLVAVLVLLLVLSLLFGGFQKGTRTGLGRPAAPAGALPATGAGAGAGAYQP
jgi:hypothetical protein